MSEPITHKNLMSTFPTALTSDESILTLARITACLLTKCFDDLPLISIYSRIDFLPEDLLDILAYDFKVDWWDYDFSLEQKRKTLRDSFIVHKRLGTKSAVETAISDVYPNSLVQEWWEYGGEPYYFRLIIEANGVNVDSQKHKRVLQLINFYKSLRSHLNGIIYRIRPNVATVYSAGVLSGCHISFCVNITNSFSATTMLYSSAVTAGSHIQLEVSINGVDTITSN